MHYMRAGRQEGDAALALTEIRAHERYISKIYSPYIGLDLKHNRATSYSDARTRGLVALYALSATPSDSDRVHEGARGRVLRLQGKQLL